MQVGRKNIHLEKIEPQVHKVEENYFAKSQRLEEDMKQKGLGLGVFAMVSFLIGFIMRGFDVLFLTGAGRVLAIFINVTLVIMMVYVIYSYSRSMYRYLQHKWDE